MPMSQMPRIVLKAYHIVLNENILSFSERIGNCGKTLAAAKKITKPQECERQEWKRGFLQNDMHKSRQVATDLHHRTGSPTMVLTNLPTC